VTDDDELGGPTVDDRYGTAARIAALERSLANHVRALTKLGNAYQALTQHYDDRHAALAREIRTLRAKVQLLDERERWVDSYRADDRDPFRELGHRGD
jgi:hypothetical protein